MKFPAYLTLVCMLRRLKRVGPKVPGWSKREVPQGRQETWWIDLSVSRSLCLCLSLSVSLPLSLSVSHSRCLSVSLFLSVYVSVSLSVSVCLSVSRFFICLSLSLFVSPRLVTVYNLLYYRGKNFEAIAFNAFRPAEQICSVALHTCRFVFKLFFLFLLSPPFRRGLLNCSSYRYNFSWSQVCRSTSEAGLATGAFALLPTNVACGAVCMIERAGCRTVNQSSEVVVLSACWNQ